ncbi:DNA methylase N-4/N-6 [Bacillus paranthracis]|uniref:DNA methylase N-4/N-6 n=1 Tax=Bacillus anthracis TaxID=1392 RepID=A0A0J1HX11_BACAN|nr:hypothetical protein [Bacillus anthracis]KLV18266.1 DNA methylase N-4/N-6 [Bacillus anthracis]
MHSVINYEQRGTYGNNKYRGNCSGKVIKDLLLHYMGDSIGKPQKQQASFCEVFAGGGTGLAVARELGFKNSIHLDLNGKFGPSWNAMKDEIPVSSFIFSHPPYHDIIKYSGNVWGQPHPDDLSRCGSYEEFIKKLDFVNAKIYRALKRGGYHAFLVGDVRRNGQYFSIIKDMTWFGSIDAHVIKTQHNCFSDQKNYRGKFIPIKHEHLIVFKKEHLWAIPIKFNVNLEKDLRDSKHATWKDVVYAAMEMIGGTATLQELYDILADTEKTKSNPNWKAKIRQTLQINQQFTPVKRGVWKFVDLEAIA